MDELLLDDEVLVEFINESREHLAHIEEDMLAIEEGGADIDEALVNKVFRAAHSIKGGSGYFGLSKVKDLAHKAETVLDMLRSKRMAPTPEVTNILLAAFDRLRDLINDIGNSEKADIEDLVAGLVGLATSFLDADKKSSMVSQVELPIENGTGSVSVAQLDMDRAQQKGWFIYWVDCDLIHDVERKGQNVLQLFNHLTETAEIIDCTVDYEAVGDLSGPIVNRVPLRLILSTSLDPQNVSSLFEGIDKKRVHTLFDPTVDVAEPAPAAAPQALVISRPAMAHDNAVAAPDSALHEKTAETRKGDGGGAQGGEDTLRVNVKLLENLMNLAGELVLSRNQLRAAVAQNNRQLLASVDGRVNQVTSELQDVIMQTRLQPIGNVFSKFPRVVRDLSRTLGKEIELDIRGKDVALDKTLIEGLSDPLTHMVRNAVDHGVETTAERMAVGKKPTGHVRIEARHEAGQVVLEISDDGKGINGDKVADAAVRKGLIAAEKVLGMSERDKQALVFLPGLSTAMTVSDVSGRGVGMDVVKTNLDRLGGQVEINSVVGQGSTFRIKLPLTLAIIPSLIVSLENERFAIPQANIEELLRLRPEETKSRIEIVGDVEVLLLRDRMLPLARFADILGVLPTYSDSATGRQEVDRRVRIADRRSPRHNLSSSNSSDCADSKEHRRRAGDRRQAATSALEIAVVTTGTMSYGLVVGAFHDTEEVVVKPLGRRLKQLREYSGATILGDGAVALILDMAGIAEKAGLSTVSGSARAAEVAAEAEAMRLQDLHSLLLFQNGPHEACAIPLDLVQRIERVTADRLEHLGSHRTMQYRGGSLPLISISDVAGLNSVDASDDLVVLVSTVAGREVGLLGAMPVDVIETHVQIDQRTHRQTGISGSAIIRDQTTLITDLYELVDAVFPDWQAARQEVAHFVAPETMTDSAPEETCVLLAEDSDFFRAQVKKYIESDGCTVLAAPDGEAAWELLVENVHRVKVVVTDVEMPRLSGLGLAARIRGDERTAHLPIIAVSSLASEEDIARGKQAGVSEYQIKLDRDKLLQSVRSYL